MLRSSSAAVVARGRAIYIAITGANTEREPLRKTWLWPKTPVAEGAENQKMDTFSNGFKTSTEYFKALLDEENYGTSKWKSHVVDFDYSKLAGAGVQACTNNHLTAANNIWSIVANITDQDNDRVPFLVTRNLDVKELERVVNQGLKKEDFNKRITFSELYVAPFRDKCVIIVFKGGKKPKSFSGKATLGDLFDHKELPPRDPSKPPIVYLMP
jgi:hypothetical protein